MTTSTAPASVARIGAPGSGRYKITIGDTVIGRVRRGAELATAKIGTGPSLWYATPSGKAEQRTAYTRRADAVAALVAAAPADEHAEQSALSSAIFPYLPLTHAPRSTHDPLPYVDADGHRPRSKFRTLTSNLDAVERGCAARHLAAAEQRAAAEQPVPVADPAPEPLIRDHTQQCIDLGHADLTCGAQDDGRMPCVAERDADPQAVAALVAFIRTHILTGIEVADFAANPGGILAQYAHDDERADTDEGTARAAFRIVLDGEQGTARTPKRGMRFVHARQREILPDVRVADSPRRAMRVTHVTATTVYFRPDDGDTIGLWDVDRATFAHETVGAYL